MKSLIKGCKEDLAQGEASCVGILRSHQLVQHLLGQGGAILVVLRHQPQALFLPHPVLKHLAGRLHKVSLHICPKEARGVGFRADSMHHMPKFMEVGLHLFVVQQAGLFCSRLKKYVKQLRLLSVSHLGEVGDHDNHRLLALPL